jgi:dipeptidyl aminopeptidase/acylaminoacyl peptidase
LNSISAVAASGLMDLRETPLYREAETWFRAVLRPGEARPTGAQDIAVSPDGKRIAFSGAVPESLEGIPPARICVVNVETGKLIVLSSGPNQDLSPKFSPDGSILAFRSDRVSAGDFQVYFIDINTGTTRRAPTVPGWVEYLEYSPDGKRLLLGVAGHGADVAGAQGAKTSPKYDEQRLPAWIPAVENGPESCPRRGVWILDIGSGALQCALPPTLNVWEACWCGTESIAAIVSPGASESDWYGAHLVSVLPASGDARILYRPKDQIGWLSSSPSGSTLAFVEAVCSDRLLVAGDLHIVQPNSGELRRIASNQIDVTFTCWRNNHQILIAGIRNLETVIADVDPKSGSLLERWSSEELYCPNQFYPYAVPWPGDDEGFVIGTVGHLRPFELLRMRGGHATTMAGFAHEGTDAVIRRLRPVQPYRWKASDGRVLDGWLMRGADEAPAPLVMEVHGGPIWRWSPSFLGRTAYHVMLAERGYAMFWPNPRGSSGRGQEHARAVVGDMGGADAQDYLSGLDQLVSDGIADLNRIGVMGLSYGGFMSSWLVTQDSRFAAAVSISPITDWISQHLTSNIPCWDSEFLQCKYSDPMSHYSARSPILFARNVKTPTLNICGALDRTTPPAQAREFHNALLESGVESVLVTYPLEGHGVRSFPALVDYAARVVGWFTHHMRPRAGVAQTE